MLSFELDDDDAYDIEDQNDDDDDDGDDFEGEDSLFRLEEPYTHQKGELQVSFTFGLSSSRETEREFELEDGEVEIEHTLPPVVPSPPASVENILGGKMRIEFFLDSIQRASNTGSHPWPPVLTVDVTPTFSQEVIQCASVYECRNGADERDNLTHISQMTLSVAYNEVMISL